MATGNISKTKGFKGPRGDIGPKGDKGDKGDFSNITFRYNEETGELSYSTELVPSVNTAPYIGENGNWYIFDGVSKKFVDSGVSSIGNDYEQYIRQYVDKQTGIIKSDVEGLQKRINEEAHFRGYLSKNFKIQALEATPNDFAYSAESGTKWIYDAEDGWIDSGVEVPNDPIPASKTTPLINGVASIGSEEAYARGDHRHPTDTTRASVKDVDGLKDEMVNVLQHITTLQAIVDKLVAKALIKTVTINLIASAWVEESDNQFSQVLSIADVTSYSKVDLQPTAEQLAIFHEKDIAFVTENVGGVVTIYCIGQKPANDYTIQATITEVETNG